MNFIEIEKVVRTKEWSMSQFQSHGYYKIYFLLEGKRKYFFENKMFNISAGTVCIIPPFGMHKTEGGTHTRVNITFSPDVLSASEKAFLDSQTAVAYKINKDILPAITTLLEHASNHTSVTANEHIELHTTKVIFSLLAEKNALTPLEVNATVTGEKKDTVILNVVSYLNQNYAEKITLTDLSKRFYVSINSLCARFNDAMNCTVNEYLTFVRISEAKKLLKTTSYDMEKVASECGFSSANYFGLVFKQKEQISPLAYRKHQQNKY